MMMIDVKDVRNELKTAIPLALLIVAVIAVLTWSSWLSTLALAGSMLLFVVMWETIKVLWRKQRTNHRGA